MAFMVMHGCAIFFIIISLNTNVIANSCENDNCKAAIDLPLITKLNAPLKAELDISGLTSQLKELIGHEVKQAVSGAMKDLAENIVDKRTQSALESLQTFINRTISSFQQEIDDESTKKTNKLNELEVLIEKNNEFHNTNHNIFANEIHSLTAQMKNNQIQTEPKTSSFESENTKNSEKVAITANCLRTEKVSRGSVMKFAVVQFSVGINKLSTFKSTGKFVCEQNGLYMISVSIMSSTNDSAFNIYLNGNIISSAYIARLNKGWWHTGTVVISRQLQTNDYVWVQTSGIYVHNTYSQLTIIKVI